MFDIESARTSVRSCDYKEYDSRRYGDGRGAFRFVIPFGDKYVIKIPREPNSRQNEIESEKWFGYVKPNGLEKYFANIVGSFYIPYEYVQEERCWRRYCDCLFCKARKNNDPSPEPLFITESVLALVFERVMPMHEVLECEADELDIYAEEEEELYYNMGLATETDTNMDDFINVMYDFGLRDVHPLNFGIRITKDGLRDLVVLDYVS